MSIYDEMQVVASELLTEFNQTDIKLVQVIPDPNSSPDCPTNIERVYQLKGVVKNSKYNYDKNSFTAVNENEVVVGVLNGVKPTINDFVEINGVRYKIKADKSTPAFGTNCVWKFIISKGD